MRYIGSDAEKRRKRIRGSLLGALTAMLAIISLAATAYADSPHAVERGENLSGIAASHGVTVEGIMAANNLQSRGLIYAGQALTIPTAPLPTYVASPTAVSPIRSTPSARPPSDATPLSSVTATEQKYVVQEGDSLTLVARRFGVTVAALAAANGLSTNSYLYIGQELMIPTSTQTLPGDVPPTATATATSTPRPPSPTPTPKPTEPPTPMGELGPKWIEIDLSTQMMVAYEGTTPVFSARMSGGLARYPTVTGTYRVYLKYRSQTMRGGTRGVDYYEVPRVPHVLYFFEGYALHGAYWHNNFGQPMSRGCVNLPLDAARWMYNWAPIGTLVVSHR